MNPAKRAHSDDHGARQHKKQKQQHVNGTRDPLNENNHNYQNPKHAHTQSSRHVKSHRLPNDRRQTPPTQPSYADALAHVPPPSTTLPPIAAYTPFLVPSHLPPLPLISDPILASAPFRHKSTAATYNRSTAAPSTVPITYERLEFLGDAQLEHLASRLLYARFPALTAGQLSQLRELLVKNETLAEYARAYGFDTRVQVMEMERMLEVAREKGQAGNKGFNKVLGDVFEAYVAAVVLSYGDEGFAVAEQWMQALWAPKLVEAGKRERYFTPGLQLVCEGSADPRMTYNPAAKAELQRRILGSGVKLDYVAYKPSVELKGAQLGQNRHFVAVYLTGYGCVRRELGKGEGRNKVEAGNWAAVEALWGPERAFVGECAKELEGVREAKRTREASERDGKEKEREEEEKEKEEKGKTREEKEETSREKGEGLHRGKE